MNITINNELLQYIDPLTANEYAALERSLLAEGCRDALVLWGEVLVDGHNRYEICRKHGIEFKTVQNTSFASIDDVMLWMIDNQLGRRSVTDFQRGVLALRKRDIISARVKAEMDASIESKDASAYEPVGDGAAKPAEDAAANNAIPSASIKTREDIARVAGISSNTVGQIEKIRKTAAPELVEAVRAGTISINAAAAVASLPSDEQVNAVAGGKKELRQAAKMVREQQAANRTPRTPPAPRAQSEDGEADNGAPFSGSSPVGSNDPVALRAEIAALNARITALTAENQALQAEVDALRGVAA
jgi:ParB-like chromosome segregation protein Spo0J